MNPTISCIGQRLITGTAFTLVIALVAAAPTQEESPESHEHGWPTSSTINVMSTHHEIHFPNRIDFTLTAESDSPITSVTFYYRFANQHVSIYGYPRFESESDITTHFSIENGLRTGVDIEYYYVIQNLAGERLKSNTYSLIYLDSAFEWQRLTLGGMEIFWHDQPNLRIRTLAEQVNRRLTEVRRVLGLKSATTVRAVILNNHIEAFHSFPSISSTATDSHLYSGFAFGEFDLFLLVGARFDGMVHEMVHLLLDQAIASPFTRVPAWYNEGLAMYFESESSLDKQTPQLTVRKNSLLRITSMLGQPGRPNDVRLFYAQAGSLFRYIAASYGEDKITEVIRALSVGVRFDDAIEATYGRTIGTIESDWRLSIGAPVLTSPDCPSPGLRYHRWP